MKNKPSDSQLIVKNLSFLYNGEIINQILTLALIIFISRTLGDVGLGKYSFAFSFASIFLLLADFGLPTLITKDIAKDRKLAQKHLSNTFTLKFALNFLTLLITVLAIFILRKDIETVILVSLAAIAMFFYNFGGVFRSVFQAYEVMKYEVISKTAERLIAAAIGIYLLLKGYGIMSLFLTLIISNIFYYVILIALVYKKILPAKISVDFQVWKQTIKESFPFWLTLIFVSFYVRIDTIMLGFMKSYAETGWYNAAYKIIDVFTRVLYLPIMALFPALAKSHRISVQKTKSLYEKSFYYMIVFALPVVAGLLVLSGKIIPLIYGPQFNNSIIALQILGFSLFFTGLNFLMGYLLNSIDKQKLFAITAGVSTFVNISLNLILIPAYGFKGAGFATVISEMLNFSMLYYFTRKSDFSVNVFKLLVKPAVAAAVMILVLYYLISLNVFFLVVLGAASYLAVMFMVKGLGKDEISLVKSVISK